MKSCFLFCFILFQLTSISAQINLEDGLLAYYPFTGNANDESGNELHPAIIEQPVLAADCQEIPEQAYSFNGINDHILVPHDESLNFGVDQPFAIALWLKAAPVQQDLSGTVNDLITKWSSTTLTSSYPFAIRYFNQNAEFPGTIFAGRYDAACNIQSSVNNVTPINNEKWHHIVFQRTMDDSLHLYLNGILEASAPDPVSCSTTNDESVIFGLRSLNDQQFVRPFTGLLDEIRFYDRTLTEDEISALANKMVTNTYNFNSTTKLKIFPNPVRGHLINISVEHDTVESAWLYDFSGRSYGKVNDGQLPLLPDGVYLVRVKLSSGQSVVKRLVVYGNKSGC